MNNNGDIGKKMKRGKHIKPETKDNDYDTVMYFFVNNDLGMGKGKIGGQVGHAVQHLIETLVVYPTAEYKEWKTALCRKIVLKATEAQLNDIIDKWGGKNNDMYVVHDAGRTQIASGSMTVVGFAPKYVCNVPPEWKDFKLL